MTHRTMITNGKELKYKQVLILDDKNNVALQKKFDRDKGIPTPKITIQDHIVAQLAEYITLVY